MAKIPESEIERIKTDISLVRLAQSAGVKLTKRGKDWIGCCPFHADKTPSFIISPQKNLWNCLGACGEGGDVIRFVMKVEGVSFRHAVEVLRDGYAPHTDLKPSGPVKRATTPKLKTFASEKEDQAMLSRVCDYYHACLKENTEGLQYLHSRGLTHPDLVETFKLGLSNRTLGYRLPEKNRKAGAQVRGQLQALGIYRTSGHEHLAGSVVVPILDMTGHVRQLYGRKIVQNLRKGTPKHLYLPGPMAGVWNEIAFKGADEIILCESLIDALTFWCAGYRNVTCAYGTNGFTPEILAALKTHQIKRVLIAYDRDAAGESAALKLTDLLNAENIETYRIQFPKGMDANSYALQVTPASESLGVLIRSAEWVGTLGAGKRVCLALPSVKANQTRSPSLAAKTMVEEKQVVTEEILPLDSAPSAPSAPSASPMPRAPVEIEAEVSEHETIFTFGDRRWRVRGLARNTSYETLRVNLLVSRVVNGADMFHVDTLDLYGARHRVGYVSQAASELGLSKDTVKGDLARILLKLEALQEAQIEAALAPTENIYEMSEEETAQGMAFLQGGDLLGQITKDAHACGIVGEDGNLVTAYLACISRKLEKPLAVLIQSTSAAGKSALMDAVLAFVPDEEQVSYAAMTGQALFYLGETAVKHKVLAIAEEEGARDAGYALKLLQSQGDLSIASTGKDPVTGKLVTQEYRVEGPVALMMTTTAIDLDEELKNRCLVLTVNEGQAQTRAIHERQRFEETLEGLLARTTKSAILAKHQNAQRLLRPLAVVNPYAQALTFLSDKTRMRRDHRKYLGLIRTIAFLHQHQRPIKSAPGANGEAIEYVEVTLEDIEAAGRLANDVLGRTLDELAPQTRTLLKLVSDMVAIKCKASDLKQGDYRFTRRDVREFTGWGLTQLKVHLKRLEELEYLLPHIGGRGRAYVYELAYNLEGETGETFVMGLIDVQALRQKNTGTHGYDVNKSGQTQHSSHPSRPQVGRVSDTGHAPENPAISHADANLAPTLPNGAYKGVQTATPSYTQDAQRRA